MTFKPELAWIALAVLLVYATATYAQAPDTPLQEAQASIKTEGNIPAWLKGAFDGDLEKNPAESCRVAAGFFRTGGWRRDPDDSAINLCETAAKEESAPADVLAYLGRSYLLKGRLEDAKQLINASHAAGSLEGMALKGTLYDKGLGVAPDKAVAESWYRLAARRGHPNAQLNLSKLLLIPGRASADHSEGFQWLIELTANGKHYMGESNLLENITSRAALPLLLDALNHPNENVRSAVARALRRQVYPEAAPALIGALSDRSLKVQQNAAMSLATKRSFDAIPALLSKLEGGSESAQSALGYIASLEAVPLLLDALKSDNTGVRRGAVVTLGEIRSPATMPALMNALKDRRREVRYAAAESLGKLRMPESVPALIDALGDVTPEVRSKAGWALGRIGSPEAVPALINAAKNNAVDSALLALKEIGSRDAIQPLIELWHREIIRNPDNAQFVAWAMTSSGPAEAALVFEAALKDLDPRVQLLAVWELEDMVDSAPFLVDAMKSTDSSVREGAAQALGEIKFRAAVPALVNALNDSDWHVRSNSAKALGKIGAPEAGPALVDALLDSDMWVQRSAANALSLIPPDDWVPLALPILESSNVKARVAAAAALVDIGRLDPLVTLFEAIHHADEDVRSEAAAILGRTRSIEALAVLLVAASDSSTAVRRKAVEALAEIGGQKAWLAVIRALGDGDVNVRYSAASSLQKSNAPELAGTIVEMLNDQHSDEQRIAAAHALSVPGLRQAVPALLVALHDQSVSVRMHASLALATIGAPETVPALFDAMSDPARTPSSAQIYELVIKPLSELGAPTALNWLLSAETPDLALAIPLVRENGWNWLVQILRGNSDRSPIANISSVHLDGPYRQIGVSNALKALDYYLTWGSPSLRFEALASGSGTTDHAGVDHQRICNGYFHMSGVVKRAAVRQSPYLDQLVGRSLLECGGHANAVLELTDKAITKTNVHERGLQIVLRWQRAEAWIDRGEPVRALAELEMVERTLLPNVSGVERSSSRILFGAHTLWLKGKAQLAAGEAGAAVASLLAAEQAIKHDVHLFNFYQREEDQLVKRESHLIYALRAQAQWEGAKRDADHAIALGSQLALDGRSQREAQETALRVRIQAAIGEGDYERAHRLTEELALMRLKWDERVAIDSASPQRRAVMDNVAKFRARIAEANRKIDDAERQASKGKTSADPSDGRNVRANSEKNLAELHRERAEARRALNQFFIGLKKTHPEVATLLGGQPTELVQVQHLIEADQSLVQFLLLDDNGYLFLITRDTIEIVELGAGRRQIDPLVTAYRANIQRAAGCTPLARGGRRVIDSVASTCATVDLDQQGQALSTMLFGRIKDRLHNTKRLTLVPNGRLHQLPFAALPFDEGKSLAQRFILNQFPAASVISLMTRQSGKQGNILAIAVPQRTGWGPLPNVEKEVQAIGKSHPGTEIKVGADASIALLKGQDLSSRPLHFATHAMAGATYNDTRLVLGDADLMLADIWGLNLDGSPRIVLSACDTGIGEQLAGDEVVSMSIGFLNAGARSVVASLWPVPDEATRHLMGRFYTYLAAGQDTASALALAQREMHAAGQPELAWAAFLVVGR